MRILLLSQFYPPIVGGVEIHVRALARGLRARGHDVEVATLAPLPPADKDDPADVPVVRLRGTAQRFGALYTTDRRHAPPVPDPEAVFALRTLVREFRPELVHAHNWLGRSFIPLKRTSGAKYVVTLHDCGILCAQGRMMLRGESLCDGPGFPKCVGCCAAFYGPLKGPVTAVGNWSMRGAEARAVDAFIPVSNAIAAANGLQDSSSVYEVIPNFVAEGSAGPPPSDPRLDQLPAQPFVLQVGDVAADKGVRVALEAYAMLAAEGAAPPLVFIGRAVGDIVPADAPGVTVTGPWPHELVGEAWRRSLFGIMPSLCLDASPTVTLEAMAAEKPVVASALGGLADQVDDGVTGFLVTPGDPTALRNAMLRLVAEPELRRTMGDAGRQRFEAQFAADVVIDRIEALYRRVLGG